MYQRQTVYKHGNVVTVVMCSIGHGILVNNLKPIVVNVLLVEQINVFRCSVVTVQNLYMVVMYATCFLGNAVVFSGDTFGEKTIPFVL